MCKAGVIKDEKKALKEMLFEHLKLQEYVQSCF